MRGACGPGEMLRLSVAACSSAYARRGHHNESMLRRRCLVVAPAAGLLGLFAFSDGAMGQPSVPLRLGADRSLAASGLADALRRAFSADTGIDVKLVVAPALAVLDAVREGEVDVALANAPAAEADLERQTLVHDRRAIAVGDFILVGPTGRGAARVDRDPVAALRQLAEEAAPFLSPGDGSGTHVAEQALWRAAGVEPKAPWYASADPRGGNVVRQARTGSTWSIVERGEWLAAGGPPLRIAAEGGEVLVEQVHAMRSFRASHPAGKFFLAWIGSRRGKAVAARRRGYRAA